MSEMVVAHVQYGRDVWTLGCVTGMAVTARPTSRLRVANGTIVRCTSARRSPVVRWRLSSASRRADGPPWLAAVRLSLPMALMSPSPSPLATRQSYFNVAHGPV